MPCCASLRAARRLCALTAATRTLTLARFVLRDNVLMYFNSPKDFTGFRDKPSVHPYPYP
eukprot:scaffold38493_cov24-Phaeocystis_antarctica.AAC.1